MAKKVVDTNTEVVKQVEKKGVNPIIIIILVLLVIGAGTFGGVYLFMNKNAKEAPIVEAKVEILKDNRVNLDDGGFLQTTVYVSYDQDNSDLGKEIVEKTVEIQDKTIFFLKSEKTEDFKAENEKALKKALIAQINEILSNGEIVNVYFPADILIQEK